MKVHLWHYTLAFTIIIAMYNNLNDNNIYTETIIAEGSATHRNLIRLCQKSLILSEINEEIKNQARLSEIKPRNQKSHQAIRNQERNQKS